MDIVIKSLSKSYNDEIVLEKYNEVFKDGQVSFIMGPSGIGKSTLFKILVGLEKSDNGSITGLEDKRVSVVFQEDSLCDRLSILSNIKLVSNDIKVNEIENNLKLLGLEGCLYKRVSELSGGMKRRVAILRAMIYGFDVLLMDEPFKGLDVDTKKQTIDFIKRYIKNKTVIIITHESENINYFENSRVVRISE